MDIKQLINSNFSRKAELVIVTIAGLSYVAGLEVADVVLIRWVADPMGDRRYRMDRHARRRGPGGDRLRASQTSQRRVIGARNRHGNGFGLRRNKMVGANGYRAKVRREIMRRRFLITAVIVALAVAGCGKVWMSAEYKEQLEMSNVVIQSLNADCQAGDDDACRRGLNESAAIVQLIVHAVNGTEEGGAGDE